MEKNIFIHSSLECPKDWHKTDTPLFSSELWGDVLSKSFNTKNIYMTVNQNSRIMMPVFKVGPFRVGYLGFPLWYGEDASLMMEEFFQALIRHQYPTRIDLIKIAVSGFCQNMLNIEPESTSPETEIIDISNWQIELLPYRVRRDIKYALKQNMIVKTSNEIEYNEKIYLLYKKTVSRNRGAVKYNSQYFSELFSTSKKSNDIYFVCALIEEQIIGFNVFLRHGQTAFALHGAIDVEFKRKRISDLLVYKGILWAKDQKVKKFNLGCSPVNQQSLIRFKEKWQAKTKKLKNYEVRINPLRAFAFKALLNLYSLISPFLNR